jgi:hypothetical protein
VGYLAAAVVFVGLLCLVDLLLSFAIIRRLRQRTDEVGGPPGVSSRVTLTPGTAAPEFEATAVDGGRFATAELLDRTTAIAFLAAQCAPCRAAVPDLVKYARSVARDVVRMVAVIDGETNPDGEFVRALREYATVVIEPGRGSVATAFSVSAFPAFYLVDDNARIVTGGPTVRHLTPELV